MPLPSLPPLEEIIPQSEPTQEQRIAQTISAARDSVWVIEEELKREVFRRESLSLLQANVSHLELVISSSDVTNSGEDLSDITAAINTGKEAIALLESAGAAP